MVRRPSLKWNLNARARRRIQVDLLWPARLFVFHFLLLSRCSSYKRKHSLNYLLNLVFLSTSRIFYVSGLIRGSACFSPTLAYEMDIVVLISRLWQKLLARTFLVLGRKISSANGSGWDLLFSPMRLSSSHSHPLDFYVSWKKSNAKRTATTFW